MTTRTDEELDAIYKAGNAHSHGAAVREVYQAGRADEAAALQPTIKGLNDRHDAALEGLKRPIKDPGAPASEVTAQPESAASPAAVGAPPAATVRGTSTVTAYTDAGEVQKPAPLVNAAPGAPAAGQNPPGEHPPSAA